MKKGRRIAIASGCAAAAASLLAVAVLTAGPGGGGDWTSARLVSFQSDDWGLCAFVPSVEVAEALDRDRLALATTPAVYWGSTLEDSASVDRLRRIFRGTRGRLELPAVFQPNYIMASLSCEPKGDSDSDFLPGPASDTVWRRRLLPDLPAAYGRPGLWDAVRRAMDDGVWEPELHGLYHYDPADRVAASAADPASDFAARNGALAFVGSERSYELAPDRGPELLRRELDLSISAFGSLFGRPPRSVVAPDYVWDRRNELMWKDAGIEVVQAKREQRRAGSGPQLAARIFKALERGWRRLTEKDLVYLERNCRFEPAQEGPGAPTAENCLRQVREAWSRGEPAVVETHRVNYVNLDPAVTERCFADLERLLAGIADIPGPRPQFVTDAELAQLRRGGVSWRILPDAVIVRNITHSRRVVCVPLPGNRHPMRISVASCGAVRVPFFSPL